MGELRMDFGNNPFGLGSSRSIKQFIHHPFLHPLHHWRRTACSSLWSPHHLHHRGVQWGCAEPVAMHTISCIAQEIGGGRGVVIEGWHFRGILPLSNTPLELLPCLLNGHTHLLPTTSQSPHLDIRPATGNDLLQTPHDVRIALHCSVGGDVDGCFRGDVGYNLKLGAGVDVLELSDGVIVEIARSQKRASDRPPSETLVSRWACSSSRSS